MFNRSKQPVALNNWSIQYSSAAASSWQKTDLSGTLLPGQYFLAQLASGGAVGALLPAPDATGTLSLAASGGKIALLNTSTLIASGVSCPTGAAVVDFVGYGNDATCFEGPQAAPGASNNTNAVRRAAQGCADTNDNGANFALGPAQPRNTATALSPCSGGPIFDTSSTAVRLSDPLVCTGPGNLVAVEASFTNIGVRAQGNNPGPEFLALLPAAFIVVPNSCVVIGGMGACGTDGAQVQWNGSIASGETVTIRYQAQVRDYADVETPQCVNSTINYDANNDGLNEATARVSDCLTALCPPPGPGEAFPFTTGPSGDRAGSVLVYPFYTSDTRDFSRTNTRISLTNIDALRPVAVHLFFVQDNAAGVADSYICLTPGQTASFLVSDLDPGVSGYLVAVAADGRTGCPVNFNYLIGDSYVKLASGHAANLGAEAFAALAGLPALCDDQSQTAEIEFDGQRYNAAPCVLAVSNLPSAAEGYESLLIVNRLNGNLASGPSTLGQLIGVLYDDMEHAFSFEFSSARRQYREIISDRFPRTSPRFSTVIPHGRTGWLKLSRLPDGALLGAVIHFNRRSGATFNQGHNLHKLAYLAGASLIIPVFPPRC